MYRLTPSLGHVKQHFELPLNLGGQVVGVVDRKSDDESELVGGFAGVPAHAVGGHRDVSQGNRTGNGDEDDGGDEQSECGEEGGGETGVPWL